MIVNYKIIVDSCGELTYRMKKSGVYETASLSMEVDGDIIVGGGLYNHENMGEIAKKMHQMIVEKG